MNNGIIFIHRKLREHWLWDISKPEYLLWWIDILCEALYKPKALVIDNNPIVIPRGSFRMSKVKFAERWKCDRRRIDRFFKLLESDGMIVQCTDRHGTTIEVCNYAEYQDYFRNDGTADGTQKNEVNKRELKKLTKEDEVLYIHNIADVMTTEEIGLIEAKNKSKDTKISQKLLLQLYLK